MAFTSNLMLMLLDTCAPGCCILMYTFGILWISYVICTHVGWWMLLNAGCLVLEKPLYHLLSCFDSLGHMSKTLPSFSSLLHSGVLRLKSGRLEPAGNKILPGSSLVHPLGSQWILEKNHPLRPLVAGPKEDRGPKCFWKTPSIAYPLDRNRKPWRLARSSTLSGDHRFHTSARRYSL